MASGPMQPAPVGTSVSNGQSSSRLSVWVRWLHPVSSQLHLLLRFTTACVPTFCS